MPMNAFEQQNFKVLVLTFILLLVGCGSNHALSNSNQVLDRLESQHQQWRGTPYRLGGYDKNGIDCSGFVAKTFDQLFNIQLPRTTTAQSKTGQKIKQKQLQAGDLVFFKIANRGKLRHVGIYLSNNQFLHASTSKGVIVSNLNNKYWQDSYWKAVRITD